MEGGAVLVSLALCEHIVHCITFVNFGHYFLVGDQDFWSMVLCMYAEIVSDASRQERFSVGHQDSWNMVPGMYAETVCRETSPIPVRDATCLSSMISTGVFCGFCGFYVFCCFGGFSVF